MSNRGRWLGQSVSDAAVAQGRPSELAHHVAVLDTVQEKE
jgi:hypothetical protein